MFLSVLMSEYLSFDSIPERNKHLALCLAGDSDDVLTTLAMVDFIVISRMECSRRKRLFSDIDSGYAASAISSAMTSVQGMDVEIGGIMKAFKCMIIIDIY